MSTDEGPDGTGKMTMEQRCWWALFGAFVGALLGFIVAGGLDLDLVVAMLGGGVTGALLSFFFGPYFWDFIT